MYLFRNSMLPRLTTLLTIALAVLLLANMMQYFQFTRTPLFFYEKLPFSANAIWRAAFYVHVTGALICLVSGFPLFFSITLRHPRVHRILGYIYINAVLWAAAPAGLIISPVAKGGFLGAAGFSITGVLWWMTTWMGYVAIRRHDIATHVRCMVFSFSLALSAVWFRVFHVALEFANVDPTANYVISLWLSLLASIYLAEVCNRKRVAAPSRIDISSFRKLQTRSSP
jgi:Predicted membrane protein (DUF2306)